MILPCDVRIASEDAKLGLAFVKLGILPGLGSTHLLPRIVGRAKALELVMTARTILAREALEIGLVNAVVPAEKLAATARELAATIAAHRPEVVAAAKAARRTSAPSTRWKRRCATRSARAPRCARRGASRWTSS